jgi:hypothetical protein
MKEYLIIFWKEKDMQQHYSITYISLNSRIDKVALDATITST